MSRHQTRYGNPPQINWTKLSVFFAVFTLTLLAPFSKIFAQTPPHLDDDDFPSSAFGAPPAQPELSIRPHRPNPLAFEEQQDTDRPPTRGLASVPGGEPPSDSLGTRASRNGVQEVSLIAGDLGFFPQTLFVAPEIPVRLYVTGASKKALCLMMDSFQIRRQVRSQKIEEIMFTPKSPGKYRFYCPVNGIEGTLLVKEKAFASPKTQKSED